MTANLAKIRGRAYQAVSRAIRSGAMTKPGTCEECGRHLPVLARHLDYRQPLNVEWLCRRCFSSKCLQLKPTEGTFIRRLYDILQASKGLPVRLNYKEYGPWGGTMGVLLEQLRNFYGLDIRRVPGSGKRDGKEGRGAQKSQYCLVGEWIDEKYVDYVAQRLAEDDASKRRET